MFTDLVENGSVVRLLKLEEYIDKHQTLLQGYCHFNYEIFSKETLILILEQVTHDSNCLEKTIMFLWV